MIRSIRHKGLRRLYEEDNPRGITGQHVTVLRDILARLDAAEAIADLGLAGLPVASAKGKFEGLLGSDGAGQLAGDLSL